MSTTSADFDRDIRARSDRDADIGGRQRRRIVDAVADKGHFPAAGGEPPDRVHLAVGEDFGDHLIDAEASRDRLRRPAVVAGYQRHREPKLVQGR